MPLEPGICAVRGVETVVLTGDVLVTIEAHAESSYPDECCGALLGRCGGAGSAAAQGDGRRELVRALPLRNDWEGRRGDRYLIPGAVIRELEAGAQRVGLEVVGYYHSHPGGTAVPSRFDLEVAWPWYSYLIIPVRGVAVAGAEAGPVRSWRLCDDRSGFVEEPLEVSGLDQKERCR